MVGASVSASSPRVIRAGPRIAARLGLSMPHRNEPVTRGLSEVEVLWTSSLLAVTSLNPLWTSGLRKWLLYTPLAL